MKIKSHAGSAKRGTVVLSKHWVPRASGRLAQARLRQWLTEQPLSQHCRSSALCRSALEVPWARAGLSLNYSGPLGLQSGFWAAFEEMLRTPFESWSGRQTFGKLLTSRLAWVAACLLCRSAPRGRWLLLVFACWVSPVGFRLFRLLDFAMDASSPPNPSSTAASASVSPSPPRKAAIPKCSSPGTKLRSQEALMHMATQNGLWIVNHH